VFELPAPRPERPSRSQPRPVLDLAALLESEAEPEAAPAPLEPSAFAPGSPSEPGPSPAAPPPELVSSPAAPAAAGDPDYAPSPWDDGPTTGATIVLSDEVSGGLDLAAVAEKSDLRPLVPQGNTQGTVGGPPTDVDLWLRAAKELFALGDFTGSLELIEKILTVDPDHGEARDYLRQNEATLVSMYESKLGPLHATPRLAIKPEEVMWLNLDHRAGFLLAQIDGSVDYEGLFAVSGLPRLDTARILANLIADGVVKS